MKLSHSVELVKILVKNLANEIMCLHALESLFISCQGPHQLTGTGGSRDKNAQKHLTRLKHSRGF